MILELTEKEQITLLGLLEDISQADDDIEAFPLQSRIAITSIIQKLGGTFYGKITKDKLSTMYGIMED